MWIELDDDFWVESDDISIIRRSTMDDNQTVIFTSGQSAMDGGFLVDRPIEEVIEAVKQARYMSIVADLEAEEKSLQDPT